MERHCVALALGNQVVRLCACALAFEGFIGVRCTLMCYFICCPNTLQWRWWLCIHLKWMHGTVLYWPLPNSTYVYIAVCVHECYWCSISVVRGCKPPCAILFVVKTHYNGDDDSALILNGCMERCCVGIGQTVRTFALLRMCTGVIGV